MICDELMSAAAEHVAEVCLQHAEEIASDSDPREQAAAAQELAELVADLLADGYRPGWMGGGDDA